VGALAGPAAAVASGVTSQVANTVTSGNYIWLWFTPVQVVIGLYAGLAARRGAFRKPWIAALWGAGLGVAAAAVSVPIAYYVFSGVTAGGVTAVTTLLRGLGVPLPVAVAAASTVTDVLDKVASFALVFAVLHSLPLRTAARFPFAERAMRREVPVSPPRP